VLAAWKKRARPTVYAFRVGERGGGKGDVEGVLKPRETDLLSEKVGKGVTGKGASFYALEEKGGEGRAHSRHRLGALLSMTIERKEGGGSVVGYAILYVVLQEKRRKRKKDRARYSPMLVKES